MTPPKKSINAGMRIQPIPPGKLMGRTKANLLISVANAFLNLRLVQGTRNLLTLSEQNATLELNAQELTASTATGKGKPT